MAKGNRGGKRAGSASTPTSVINSVHKAAIAELERKGNKVEAYEAFEINNVNKSKDSHLVIALVKSKAGNYSIRGAYFSALTSDSPYGSSEYKQRSNFENRRLLKGDTQASAKQAFDYYIDTYNNIFKR